MIPPAMPQKQIDLATIENDAYKAANKVGMVIGFLAEEVKRLSGELATLKKENTRMVEKLMTDGKKEEKPECPQK